MIEYRISMFCKILIFTEYYLNFQSFNIHHFCSHLSKIFIDLKIIQRLFLFLNIIHFFIKIKLL